MGFSIGSVDLILGQESVIEALVDPTQFKFSIWNLFLNLEPKFK